MLSVVLLSVFALFAQAPAAPVFHVEKQEVDLGDCHYLDPAYHKFVVTNPGGHELTFDVAKRSCGCLSEVVSHNVVVPGQKAQVALCFKPSVENILSGEQSFAVWLSTNDPGHKIVELSMRVRLREPVECDPTHINFGAVKPGETVRRRFRVICFGKHTIPAITSVEATSPAVQLRKLDENQANKLCETTHEACWKAPATAGRLNASLLIATDSPQRPVIEVRIKGEVQNERGG